MISLILITVSVITYLGIPPHWSILIGVLFSLVFSPNSATQRQGKAWSSRILQFSIVLLGAGLNFQSVLKQGGEGLALTFFSITGVFLLGHLLAQLFKVPSPLSTLITSGTSICGGSAIAAISPILKADSVTMATALGIVFILNAVSVFIFPPVAHFFHFSQLQFGTWAALAIHDTSSVVAASQLYGEEALKVGTTLKLTRALWIIPLSLLLASFNKSEKKIPVPWFIFYFLALSLLFSFLADLHFLIPYFTKISKLGLSLTLFLIGLSLDKTQLRQIGVRPIFFGISLWLVTLVGAFMYVKLLK